MTRQYPSHHATDAGVERYHSSIAIGLPSQRWIKIFHPYPSFGFSDWTLSDETWLLTHSCRLHPSGHIKAPRHSPCLPVDQIERRVSSSRSCQIHIDTGDGERSHREVSRWRNRSAACRVCFCFVPSRSQHLQDYDLGDSHERAASR
jgi:hypothetical protein